MSTNEGKSTSNNSGNKSGNKSRNNNNSGNRFGFSGGIAGIVQLFVVLASLLQVIVAVAHIIDALEDLEQCKETKNSDIECVGKSLFWDNGKKNVETDSNLNLHWRLGGFTFIPSIFVDLWTPVVFAAVCIMQMFNATRFAVISGNMLRGCLFLLIMALFGTYGYSGQLGVGSGFIVVIASAFCLIAYAMRINASPFPAFR